VAFGHKHHFYSKLVVTKRGADNNWIDRNTAKRRNFNVIQYLTIACPFDYFPLEQVVMTRHRLDSDVTA